MGFLNKRSEIVIDAVITKTGRKYLSKAVLGEHIVIDSDGLQQIVPGTHSHKITKFALSDDEVDYGHWEMTPTGSNEYIPYGAVIDNLPLTEAVFNSSETMNYLLFKRGMHSRIGESSLPIPTMNSVNATVLPGTSIYTINVDWSDVEDFNSINGDVYRLFVNNIFTERNITKSKIFINQVARYTNVNVRKKCESFNSI